MLRLSEQVKHVASCESLSERQILAAVHRSSPYSGGVVNRRYHDWAFTVEGEVVTLMRTVEAPLHTGTGMATVVVKCEHCAGKGCRKCGYHGTHIHFA